MRKLGMLAAIAAVTCAIVPVASAQTAATTIRVTASDFKFKLSTRTVRKGTVVFKVKNAGKVGHDFKIGGKKSALIAPGQTKTLKVVFKKAGKYKYVCTVAGHATLGMKGVLTVRS